MNKSIIIIGAGITGLATGCYGRMNGFDTRIYELHSLPGGLCTAWKRKGYTFDGCIHWLVGSRPGSSMNLFWRELGAAQDRPIHNPHEFLYAEDQHGRSLSVSTNLDELETNLLAIAPEDETEIRKFIRTAKQMSSFAKVMPSPGQMPPLRNLPALAVTALPVLLAMRKFGRISIQEYAKRFKSSFLRTAFLGMFDMPDFPMTGMLFTLAWMDDQDAGYPVGGSLAFAQDIEKRYLDLGGEIYYNRRVEKILVEDGPDGSQAVGVRLEDGTEERADYVISAADGYATLYKMLDGKFLTDELREAYKAARIFDPIIQVSLGVDMDLRDQPESMGILLDEPVTIAGEKIRRIGFRNFTFDPTLMPPGKGILTTSLRANYAYWKDLAGDGERYEAEKQQAAITVINVLEKRIPGLSAKVEVVDVATPLTYERYTGNWQGSMEGWLMTTQNFGKTMARKLPGLENFMMAGQWVVPGGGVPTGAMEGRSVVQQICKAEKVPFRTTTV